MQTEKYNFVTLYRRFFGVFMPVFMSLCLVLSALYFIDQYLHRHNSANLKKWEEKANYALEQAQSGSNFASLFTRFGNKLARRIELSGPESITPSAFVENYQRVFPDNFCSGGDITWLFSVQGLKANALTGKGLQSSKLSIMSRVMNALLEFANNKNITDQEINRHEKLVKGVFGPHSAPFQLGISREGRLSHVTFNRKKYYLYWRQYKNKNTTHAAVMILIPAKTVENQIFALSFSANKIYEESKRTLALAFLPSESMENVFPTIIPEVFKTDSALRNRLINVLNNARKKAGSNESKKNELIVEMEEYLVLPGKTGIDLPYDIFIFAPIPDAVRHDRPSTTKVILLMAGIWAILFTLRYMQAGKFGFSMKLSFMLLFFFSGLLPIFFMLSMGFSLIEESYSNSVYELRQENAAKLEDIDQRTDGLVAIFGQNISNLLRSENLQNLLLSDKISDLYNAFNAARNNLLQKEVELDFLMVFQPGGINELLLHDQRQKRVIQSSMDIFAPAVFHINENFAKVASLPPIILSSSQKTVYQLLGGRQQLFLQEIFDLSYEKESAIKLGNNNRDFYFSTILSQNGTIKSYLTFIASSDSMFRKYLSRELNNLNSDSPVTYFAGEELQNSDFSVFPFKKQSILDSSIGKRAFKFLQTCKHSSFNQHLTGNDYLLITVPFSKNRNFAGACIVPLDQINRSRDMKKLGMLTLALAFMLIMYFLSSLATRRILEPLEKIISVLAEIGKGQLDKRLSLGSSGEIGKLGTTVNLMADGLKQRQRLGQFVSTTFDKSISTFKHDIGKPQKISAAILFSDIRNFTGISEENSPAVLTEMLNFHLESMAQIIQKHGGQVDQFIGDAIVALFPENTESLKLNAIKAAAEMRLAHEEIIKERKSRGLFSYEIGIGLEYGQVLTGALITSERSEFCIIGDAKAMAEKYEQESKKGSFSKIIISSQLLASINDCPGLSAVRLTGSELYEIVVAEETR